MLEELQNLVRQHAGDAIINNPAIPNERNEEVVSDASNSIVDGLKNAISSGNTDGVADLFKGGSQAAMTSPITQNIQGGFVQNLMSKFGLDHGIASTLAASLIPTVLSKFVHKTNDPNDSSFNLSSVLGSLTGGAGGGIGDILSKITGTTNATNTTGNTEEGGILGKIKGMFN